MVKKMKKIVIFVSLMFVLIHGGLLAQEKDFKLINALQYHKGMYDAQKPEIIMKIPFGSGDGEVGGSEQDVEIYSEGVPFAFRPMKDKSVWILDSVNHALKNFSARGKLLKMISVKDYGKVVRDLVVDEGGSFWLLSPLEGFIHRLAPDGRHVSKIEGFQEARAIEAGNNGELLVDMPIMSSVLRFGADELIKEVCPYDIGVSLFEGVGGKLLGLEMSDKNVKLILRNQVKPVQNLVLAEFPLSGFPEDVTYAGAEILGRDSKHNLYVNLIACNKDGVIFRDRLYKCSIGGKIKAQVDVLTVPCLTPDIPRTRVVTPDGRIMTFFIKDDSYALAGYKF
jgi:hypothetical protein